MSPIEREEPTYKPTRRKLILAYSCIVILIVVFVGFMWVSNYDTGAAGWILGVVFLAMIGWILFAYLPNEKYK